MKKQTKRDNLEGVIAPGPEKGFSQLLNSLSSIGQQVELYQNKSFRYNYIFNLVILL